MKKKSILTMLLLIAMFVSCMVFLSGCSLLEEFFGDSTPKEYIIQYTDDSGLHQINVTEGMLFAMEEIPERTGYTFIGLFDAEEGGTQYTSASGSSLSTFKDKKNIVLFPQFKANTYTVVLDYQSAAISGSRELTATYGVSIPELPKTVQLDKKTFSGWYTKPNCQGIQIADSFGLIPIVSVVNDINFDLSGDYIYLYAGFETKKVTVTCYFSNGMSYENVQVEYDSSASKIVTKTRVNGNAPITWSETQNGSVFSGKITEDMVLYALEYAPVIDFDSNGGNETTSLVARANTSITLPVPTHDVAKFLYWEDANGNTYSSSTMPSQSITLKAVWQAKLVFDENGGSDVNDISVMSGSSISLPSTEKDGYVFAGWYTEDKERYTSTRMPTSGIKLKAGWFKSRVETITVIKDSSGSLDGCAHTSFMGDKTIGPKETWRNEINLSDYIPETGASVKLTFHFKMSRNFSATTAYGGLYLYDGATVSNAYLLVSYTDRVQGLKTDFSQHSFTADVKMDSDRLFMCYYAKTTNTPSGWEQVYYTDIWFEMEYPDTTKLYL